MRTCTTIGQYASYYNAFNVYCRELAPGTVSLTGYRAQGDDDKHCANCTFEIKSGDIHNVITVTNIKKINLWHRPVFLGSLSVHSYILVSHC